MRTLIPVLLAIGVFGLLAGWAVRGIRRATGAPADRPPSPLQRLVEGLIFLSAFVLVVFVVFAVVVVGDD
jgi:heme/copper-type cytochrome/quinol oxidase subunit 2